MAQATSLKFKTALKIKALRKRRGFTQEELANAAELEYKYIQRIESKNPPNLGIETLEKIAKALKVSISKILESK
jgi:transcriptional regulator with XRE-family HTH domain